MSEKIYGGHTVAALREFIAHSEETGENIDFVTGDDSTSANVIRDLLAALPSDAAQAPLGVLAGAPASALGTEWIAGLIERLERHSDDDRNTLFARSTMGELLDALKGSQLIAAPVAPAAAAPINLEGLRKKLLTPGDIHRDENGWTFHAALPICDEGTHLDKFLAAFGIRAAFVAMESDLPDFAERWHEEGLSDCSPWNPTPPDGAGWLLLAIYDTEDGPYALFGLDLYEAENALKRQRTRELGAYFQQRHADDGAAQ